MTEMTEMTEWLNDWIDWIDWNDRNEKWLNWLNWLNWQKWTDLKHTILRYSLHRCFSVESRRINTKKTNRSCRSQPGMERSDGAYIKVNQHSSNSNYYHWLASNRQSIAYFLEYENSAGCRNPHIWLLEPSWFWLHVGNDTIGYSSG